MSEEVTKLPLEQSRGEGNRYVFWCDAHMQQRSYGACLHLTEAYQAGRLQPDLDAIQGDCAHAMMQGNCMAMKMRSEEIAADQCLYFKPKRESGDMTSAKVFDRASPSYIRGWNQVGGNKAAPLDAPRVERVIPPPNLRKPEAHKLKEAAFQREQESLRAAPSYADLITDMAKSEAKAAPVSKPSPLPATPTGESLLDRARRLAAIKRSTVNE